MTRTTCTYPISEWSDLIQKQQLTGKTFYQESWSSREGTLLGIRADDPVERHWQSSVEPENLFWIHVALFDLSYRWEWYENWNADSFNSKLHQKIFKSSNKQSWPKTLTAAHTSIKYLWDISFPKPCNTFFVPYLSYCLQPRMVHEQSSLKSKK